MENKKTCTYCGKEDFNGRKYNNEFYCGRHYRQLLKYGKIKRTRQDLNEIILYNDHAEIILYNKNQKEIARATIDLDDIEKIKDYRWNFDTKKGYATTHYDDKIICLHNLIMGYDVDHINRNKLCNEKWNFRKVNKSENMMNSIISIRNTSGVKGVSWDSSRNKWAASIRAYGHTYNLGRYDNFDDAVEVRIKYEAKLFNKYSQYYNPNTNLIEFKYYSGGKEKYIIIAI